MKQLCEQCKKEYEPQYEIMQDVALGHEVEVETTEGKCDACREAVSEDIF